MPGVVIMASDDELFEGLRDLAEELDRQHKYSDAGMVRALVDRYRNLLSELGKED